MREIVIATVGAIALVLLSGAAFFTVLPACGVDESWTLLWGDQCPGAEDQRDRAEDAGREQAALLDEIASLERDIAALRCEAPPEPPKPEPKPEPEPEKAEVDPPPEEIAQCEPTQKAVKASEIWFVFDTSTSMGWSIDLPKELEDRYDRARSRANVNPGGGFGAIIGALQQGSQISALERQIKNYPGERRINVARSVTIDAIQSAPPDVSVGLVSFRECDVLNEGRYAPDQRSRLISRVRGLRDIAATPLASAVLQASRLIQGGDTPDDFVNMVVLSDGRDSCNGDPCAAARRAKAAKPGLVINVVDLAGYGEIRCMADATGGFYKQRRQGMDISELKRSMREAAGYEGQGLCR